MTKKTTKQPGPSSSDRYEDLIDDLERIVRAIESGETGLEESIGAYEQGVGLIKRARAILDQAEQRITELDPSASEIGGESSGSDD